MFCVKFFTLLLFLYFIKGLRNDKLEFSFLVLLSILFCVILSVSRFSRASSYPPAPLFFFSVPHPANKKAPEILIYSRCILLLRSRISARISIFRPVSRPDDNSRANDDDKLQSDVLMHRKCPPAGKSPSAESCRALILVPSSLTNLRRCSDTDDL